MWRFVHGYKELIRNKISVSIGPPQGFLFPLQLILTGLFKQNFLKYAEQSLHDFGSGLLLRLLHHLPVDHEPVSPPSEDHGEQLGNTQQRLTETKSFCFVRPSKLLSSGGEPFSLTRSRVVSSVCFSFDFFSVGQLEQETRGSEGLL